MSLGSALVAALLAGASADVSGPKADNGGGERPPSPRPQVAEGLRGLPVRIILRAVTGETKPVEFLIRERPRAGTLSDPIPMPRDGVDDRAVVTYTADPDSTEGEDVFTFAARLAGGPVSAAVPVTIAIASPAPDLETFRQLDFDDVMIGESYPKKLLVKNTGTGMLVEDVKLPPPWFLADPSRPLEVPAGSEGILRIVYAPDEPGENQHLLQIGGGEKAGGAQVLLTGRGVAPFVAAPPLLRTHWDEAAGVRRAILRVFNNTGARKTLDVSTDSRVEVPEKIALEPKESVDVPVEVSGDNGPYEGQIVFRWNSYSQPVRVIVAAEPAVLEILGEASGSSPLLVPATVAGDERLIPVTIKNIGGEEGDVLAEATTPFFVRQSDRSFTIQEGEQRTLEVGVSSSVVGNFKGTLQVFCDGRETAIPITGSVVHTLADAAEADAEMQANSTRDAALERARQKFTAANPNLVLPTSPRPRSDRLSGHELKLNTFLFERGISKNRNYASSVPPVERWGLKERDTRSLTLGWFPPNGDGDFDYEVEYQRLVYVPSARRMMKFWETFPKQEVGKPDKDGIITAKLTELDPYTFHTFRVLVNQVGVGWSAPSQPLRFGTEATPRIPWRWLIVGLMAAGIVCVYVFRPSVE